MKRPPRGTLSPRHRQILALLAEGKSDQEIAAATGLACQTIRHHTRAIYAAIGVEGKGNPRVAAAVWWARNPGAFT
jgi:DNA-binding NarL/FixJ family response regulator